MLELSKKLAFQWRGCFLALLISFALSAQVNLVTNGSFEHILDYNSPFIEYKAIGWSGLDSSLFTARLYNEVYGNAPNTPVGFQIPKDSSGFIRLSLYCPACGNSFTRSNLKNRLKKPLKKSSTYCATMYVSRQDDCTRSIDGFGFYFGGSEIDTIKYNARLPLVFLSPQVENPVGNIIADADNWIAVTGTFVASGNEKYMVIANFRSDAATTTTPTPYTGMTLAFSEYFVDAVSCIELDPDFAGPDTTILPGDSLFLGKTNEDDWLDARFSWYSLPGMVPLDTVTGFYARPAVTSSYVVKQEICGYTILDTIVVSVKQDDVRVAEQRGERLRLYPVPANETIRLVTDVPHWYQGVDQYTLTDALGNMVAKGAFLLLAGGFELDVSEYPSGAYTLLLSGPQTPGVVKRIFITK